MQFQSIADYVDVERGKVVRMCDRKKLNTKNGVINEEYRLAFDIAPYSRIGNDQCIFSAFEWTAWTTCTMGSMAYIKNIQKPNDEFYTAQELKEFCDMYESYHELGGNGTGTKMYEEIKDLHLNKKKGD